MDFKRFNGSTWETVQHKIYGSGTDSLTTFPAMIQAAGEPLIDYTIIGNTVQNGTPTPEAPVDATGCGERTWNLFDYSTITTGYRIQWANGAPYADDTAIVSDYIPVIDGDYALNMSVVIIGYASDKSYVGVYCSEKTWEKRSSEAFSAFTVSSSSNVKFIRLMTHAAYEPISNTLLLNAGSTALPYEPYGYKIPVTSGGVTTNLYLDAPLGAGDTLTYTDTGIALPTVDGDNTITFGTSVQPSGMSATFKGWHPVQAAKQYDGNDWS